jgi:hypothetical protein
LRREAAAQLKKPAWTAAQDNDPGRSAAIRRMVEIGLKAKGAKP